MADAETCPLSEPHAPKEGSVEAFEKLLHDIKKELIHLRHTHDKHEPEYFSAVKDLSDHDLASFDVSCLEQVRVGESAYGLHIFGKVRLPKADGKYIHVRMFVGGADGGSETVYKLHSIYTEESTEREADGTRRYRAIMEKDDPLEWFNE